MHGEWRRTVAALCATALFFFATATAQQPAPMDAAERSDVIARVAQLLETRFYDEARAARTAQALRDRLAAGGYDRFERPEAFAEAITEHVRPLLNDQHFFVSFSPPAPPPTAQTAAAGAEPAPEAQDRDAVLRAAYRVRNFDFREAAILDGNVGYLRLFTFAPARMGRDTAAAAMRFLANTDAIILDLRGNQGGYPDLGLFVASYFFDRSTHYATRYRRAGNRSEELWTLAELPGPRLARQDIYILIGRDTFSGGESLAYSLQALGRATIVGERTRGGATGADLLRAGERFEVNVSDVNYTSPATGSNWEGVGVRPDIATARSEALTAAHLAALTRLAGRTSDARLRTQLSWAKDLVRARAEPPRIHPNRLQALAGEYGERSVFWEADRLLYRRGADPIYELRAVGVDEFMIDGALTARFRFIRDRRGRGHSLIALFSDGSTETAVRSG